MTDRQTGLRGEQAIRLSEGRYRALATASNDVIYRMSPDWREMRELDGRGFLVDTDEPSETWLERYIHRDDRALVTTAIAWAVRNKRMFELEHRVVRADGSLGWTFSRAVPMLGDDGEIVEWVGAASDISARKAAEAALTASEARQAFVLRVSDALRALSDPVEIKTTAARMLVEQLDASRAMYCEFEGEGDDAMALVEGQYARGVPLFPARARYADFARGFPDGALRGGDILVVDDAATDERLDADVRAAWLRAEVAAAIGVGLVLHGRMVANFGLQSAVPRRWTAMEIRVVREVADRTWVAVERARTASALREANDVLEQRVAERTAEVQTLLKRLLSAQEEERQRIARDIHDLLGQHLTAMRVGLELLKVQATGHDELAAQVAHTLRLAEDLDRSVDTITSQLRPAALDHLGLPAALRDLATAWAERNGVAVEVDWSGVDRQRLRDEVETNLFRIAQEALHNVTKHAGATHVTVLLTERDGALILLVEDDGRGFEVPAVAAPHGNTMGLASMRERAALIGGQFEIESAPGRGTAVLVTAPLRP